MKVPPLVVMFRPHVPRLLSQVPTVATHGAGSGSHVGFGTSSDAKGATEVPRSTSLANFGTPDVAMGATDVPSFARHADMLRFVRMLCVQRQNRRATSPSEHRSLNQMLREGSRAWHGVKLGQPDWSFDSHSLALSTACRKDNLLLYLILNAYSKPLEFELPPMSPENDLWRRWIDTSLDSPSDIVEWSAAPTVMNPTYLAQPHSVVALFAWMRDSMRSDTRA